MRSATLMVFALLLSTTPRVHAQDANDLLRAVVDGLEKSNKKKKGSKKTDKKSGEKKTDENEPSPGERDSEAPTDASPTQEAASKPKAAERKPPPGYVKKTETVVKKGDLKRLAGSTSFDESIVGACFDADLNAIDGRLQGSPKSRDADEQSTNVIFINSDEQKRLNLSILNLFGVAQEEQLEKNFLLITSMTGLKKWTMDSMTAIKTAPAEAAFCATEATEGRTVDVLYHSKSALSGLELSGLSLSGEGSLETIRQRYNMEYQFKVRGYKPRDGAPLPKFTSLGEVMGSVEPGAPFFSEVTLVATADQTRDYFESTKTVSERFTLLDGYAAQYKLAKTGDVSVEVTATAGVSLSFPSTDECKSLRESTKHVFTCTLTTPTVMEVTNPSTFGLGRSADVSVVVKSTSRK